MGVGFIGREQRHTFKTKAMRNRGAEKSFAALTVMVALGLLYAAQRDVASAWMEMVEAQIRDRDVTDPAVLKAMERVPRHLMVPPGQAAADRGAISTISLPAFIKATIDRRRKIEGSISEVDRSIAAAREEIAEAFQEFKKYETAHGNHLRREALKQSRREQTASDELGIELHRRQARVAQG